MAEKSTFIKLDRNIIKWRWYKNANTMRVFLHLLITANVTDCNFETITVHRGQRIISYPNLAKELDMTQMEVRTAIKHLKLTGELTGSAMPKYTIITISNYNDYQSVTYKLTGRQQGDNSQLTVEQQQYNNTNNTNNEKEYSPAPADEIDTLKNRCF